MPRPTEDELIATYLAPLAGPGGFGLRDDAALATPAPGHDLVVTKDMLVAGVHFFADDPPDAIARKALRVNLSDLAAKAARPVGFLLGLALPADWTENWLAAFVAGLGADAADFGCPLLGGDTVAMPGPLTISITAFGEVPAGRMVPRTGTKPGDVIYVTGTIGDAAVGLRCRQATSGDAGWLAALAPEQLAFLRCRYLLPEPRLGFGGALAHVRAAMDVSDGLVGDLSKMLKPEGLGAAVAAADVPLSPAVRVAVGLRRDLVARVLGGGDDYEILCAVAPECVASFEAAAAAARIPATRLTTATLVGAVAVTDAKGHPLDVGGGRFDHFG